MADSTRREFARRIRQGRPAAARATAASTRRRSTATTRPSAPVLDAFLRGRTGDVLEIGSGTGQHAVAFASRLPAITWWPTDLNDNHLRSIAAWRAHAKLDNVQAAGPPRRQRAGLAAGRAGPARCIHRDVLRQRHPHIAVGGGGRPVRRRRHAICVAGGRLFLYGPFKRDGAHNAPSNAAFDAEPAQPESGMGRARYRRSAGACRQERAAFRRACRDAVEQRDSDFRTI